MWGALRDRRFRRLLAGQSLSSFGDSAMYLALAIWAKDLTGSNAAAGAVFLAQGAPSLLAPLAGQLVDRTRRQPILLGANAVTGLAVLSLLTVRSDEQLWVIYAFSAFYGLASEVIGAAQGALIKDMLPDGDLASAGAAFHTAQQGLRVLSPLVGAGLYTWVGGGGLAIFDAVTFAAAIVALMTIKVVESPIEPWRQSRLRDQLVAGFVHTWKTLPLRRITWASVVTMLVLGFYESLTFAVLDALGRPSSFFGVLMGVQAVGSILGGLVVAGLIGRLGEQRVLGIGLAAWVVASLAYTFAAVPVACAALFVFGVAVTFHAVARGTAILRLTPSRIVGRTQTTVSTVTNGAQTISIAVGAALIDIVDYRILLLIIAITVTTATVPLLRRPRDLT